LEYLVIPIRVGNLNQLFHLRSLFVTMAISALNIPSDLFSSVVFVTVNSY